MADQYTGNPCPVCGQDFTPGDDIVVCPDCGTPYHRTCWDTVGHCVHEAEHAAGFEWKPSYVPPKDDVVCPNCHLPSPADTEQCPRCGFMFKVKVRGENGNGPVYEQGRPYAGRREPRIPRMAVLSAGPDGSIYRREVGPEDSIDGIKARDWAVFVGRSSPYYLMQFFRMSTTRRRIGLSASAFVFGPAYFFYRKMWREGVFFAALSLLFSMPSMLAQLSLAGIYPVAGWNMPWLADALEVCYYAGWALNFVMCLFAVYWYKQVATRRILEIYARVPEGQARTDALMLTGGTSLPAALLCFVALTGISVFVTLLVFPALQTVIGGTAI